MKREWKPGDGDLAVVSWQSESGRHGGTMLALRCSDAYDQPYWQTQTFGGVIDERVTNVRPLVVIDPEDREQVERFLAALDEAFEPDLDPRDDWDTAVPTLQSALRNFVTPKPDEPTGLGAVVEDAKGRRWVLTGDVQWAGPWYCGALPEEECGDDGAFRHYRALPVVRVLSEGVAQ